jgi:Ser-tRNA(Ala) deacylase AlaX
MKNYDPRMHTAEHILNQTMDKLYGCGRSFNAHIEKKKSKCDYKIDRNLSPEEVTHIEEKVNSVIQKELPVTEKFIDFKEAKEKYNLEKLPEDAGEDIRIIEVGDYDACPCIGHHVKNTSDIEKFKIISTDLHNGNLRIRFKVGNGV